MDICALSDVCKVICQSHSG